ncbi:MAG TPA: hypothetical protein VLK34_01780 [Nocardioidaceae bacterium]|nr:hypothetical protein [Nocardioidaceae bacterium]
MPGRGRGRRRRILVIAHEDVGADKIDTAKGAAEKSLDKLDGKDDDFTAPAGEQAHDHSHEHAHGDDAPHSHPHEHSGEHTHEHPQQ